MIEIQTSREADPTHHLTVGDWIDGNIAALIGDGADVASVVRWD